MRNPGWLITYSGERVLVKNFSARRRSQLRTAVPGNGLPVPGVP